MKKVYLTLVMPSGHEEKIDIEDIGQYPALGDWLIEKVSQMNINAEAQKGFEPHEEGHPIYALLALFGT